MSALDENAERPTPYRPADADAFRSAFTGGEVPVGVYGLGKMGLPLAAVYADVTGDVRGADVDPDVVEAVNAGESPVRGEPGLDELVGDLVASGALRADTEPRRVAEAARVHVAIVPTLIDAQDRPDLSVLETVARDVATGLDPGDLVVVESTVPPRTCRDTLLPLLEAESGLDAEEFGLAFCPERTSSGRALEDIRGAYPKIVGGVDDESTRAAERVYREITDNEVVPVSDATTAEAVKVFEGVYRDVNIALANELGRHAGELGIDVTEAIEAANTQPFCEIHRPGAGVGGHCIPYYPRFLIAPFDGDSRLMETAREVNEAMPEYTAEQALTGLEAVGLSPARARVLVLGLTYRPGVDEIRATPALPAVGRLATAGADVAAVDPVTEQTEPFEEAGAEVIDFGTVEAVAGPSDRDGATTGDETAGDETTDAEGFDAVVLVTDQEAFADLDVAALGRGEDRPLVVVDGRQALIGLADDEAVHYRGVGVNV